MYYDIRCIEEIVAKRYLEDYLDFLKRVGQEATDNISRNLESKSLFMLLTLVCRLNDNIGITLSIDTCVHSVYF